MPLSPTQLTALKAGIQAETNAAFVGYRNAGQTGLMAEWLNDIKTPTANAWRTAVPPQDIDEATPWTRFDTLAASKRESWNIGFLRYGRDFSKQTIRRWVTDVWGSATANSDAESILTGAGLRPITRAEAILGGTTTATTGTVTALKLSWEGPLSDYDISQALEA